MSGKETYETPDAQPLPVFSPRDDHAHLISRSGLASKSTDIRTENLDIAASRKKFQKDTEKSAVAEDPVILRPRALYRSFLRWNARTDTYQLEMADPALKETPAQRLRRLMHEVHELTEDVEQLQESDQQQNKELDMEHQVLLTQAQGLKMDLEQLGIDLKQVTEDNLHQIPLAREALKSRKLVERLKKVNELSANDTMQVNGKEQVISRESITKTDGLEARITLLEKLIGNDQVITNNGPNQVILNILFTFPL